MNKVASKLRSVVPANDLKSLNRLKGEREEVDLNIISFRADVCFVKSGDEVEIPNECFATHFRDVHVLRAGCQGAAT